MLITPNNIVYYLLERDLLTPESIVDGDLIVVDASRRNRNFKVIRKHSPSYFVKQIQNWEQQAIITLQCEAMCYWLSQSDAAFAPLALLVPRFYTYDSARHILIVELLPEGENLSEYQRRLGEFPLDVASKLGKVLGTYHQEVGAKLPNSPHYASFPKKMPWILSVHQHSPYLFNPLSAANSQLLSVVQKYPEFHQALNALQSQWQINSLIHGDMKWDNCIVYKQSDQCDEAGLKVVDWELADLGDACWDVGAIFQAYLSFWILSMQMLADTSPAQLVDIAQYPLEKMQPAIQMFWKTYVDTMQMDDMLIQERLERSVKYGAARMIQTAYEYMAFSPQITANALYLLQLSFNILKSPQEAISELLGM
jgi:thiamine kinase-like enzyme